MEEKNKDQLGATAALAVAAGVVALVAWGISKCFERSKPEPEPAHKDKMMKAPGKGYSMPRKDFEEDPSTYFRKLRDKK